MNCRRVLSGSFIADGVPGYTDIPAGCQKGGSYKRARNKSNRRNKKKKPTKKQTKKKNSVPKNKTNTKKKKVNLNEIVEANTSAQELYSAVNKVTEFKKEQRRGGDWGGLGMDILVWIIKIPVKVIEYILKNLLAHQLDPRFTFTKKSNKSGFWKFIIFALKCGLYLCVFAVAGPIFMLIGITMIYGKLFKKMNDNPNESVVDFVYRKKDDGLV